MSAKDLFRRIILVSVQTIKTKRNSQSAYYRREKELKYFRSSLFQLHCKLAELDFNDVKDALNPILKEAEELNNIYMKKKNIKK